MFISQLPTIAQPPADYPYLVGLLVSVLGIIIAAVWIGARAAAKFMVSLLDKFEKRADDERSRADRQAQEAVVRWELGEKAKQERGDRLDARITESNAELEAFWTAKNDETNARIAATEKTINTHDNRLRGLEKARKQPPKEGA